MALVPIRIDRTSKPPIGTPLRSDGHWSVQGLVGVWAFNEGAGVSVFDATGLSSPGTLGTSTKFTAAGVKYSHPGSNTDRVVIPATAKQSLQNYTLVTSVNFPAAESNTSIHTRVGGPTLGTTYNASGMGAWKYSGASLSISPSLNTKYVVAVVQRSGAGTPWDVYVDSNLLGSGAFGTAPPVTASEWIFGNASLSGYGSSGCYQDFVLLFSRSLIVAEIASLTANPWQIYEPETVWVEVGGGGEAALFEGILSGQASTSAQLATAIRMAASAQGYGSAAADLSTTIALAADILAASSASGALSTAIRFGGALSGSSTTTAELTNAITMAAQAAGLGSISGQLAGTVAAALFAGTISGSSSASANLSTAVVLAAAAQGSATAQAALSTALELAAQVNGIGSATGALGADIPGLSGSLSGSSEAQATLSTAIHLMGLAAGQCGVVGRLAEPVEILAQLRVMASDPLALTISVRDPLALRVTVQ